MNARNPSEHELLEVEELRLRLAEAEETLRAIRSGEVDSLVVDGPDGPRVFALEGSNNSYRVLVESMNEGAATLTADGTVLYCNLRFAEMLGLPLESIMGGGLRDHVATEQLAWFDMLVRNGWKAPTKGEMQLRTRDGATITVQLSLSTFADPAPVLCVVATDLSEHIRARQLAESEKRAVARSMALEEADRRKDEFLGMLSHELRNPLAPIRNSAYILKHANPASTQAARARDVIERQAEHLTRLVDDLLDVTRVARGKMTLHRLRVDLRELLRRVADDLSSMMYERGLAFHTALPDAAVWADADATRLTQMVGNLLHNSAKFTAAGGEVTLSLVAQGGQAEIGVRDTGMGIDGTLLPHIFDAFVQSDRTLARTEGGLGLGLALARGIAQLHGGTICAESAGTGRGATFKACIPLTTAAASQDVPASPAAGRTHDRRHVLVVDDNADAAESLAEIVKLLGHAVTVAYDGPSAVEMARANPPDVVLCDIGLPGMTGYEIARILRAEHVNGIRLVAVTGYAQSDDVKRAIEAGFDDHVAKPCAPAEIERLLS